MRYTLLIIAFAGLLTFAGCHSEPDNPEYSATPAGEASAEASATPAASETPAERDDTISLKKTTIKTREGQKWELEAGQVDWSDSHSQAKATGVNWWLLDEDDKRWVKVESPEADIDMDHEIVTFEGKTVATRLGFPETLEVQHLVYKGKDRKFYGSGGVVWKRANLELSGETLTATSQLDKVQLKGKVKGKSKGGFEWFDELQKSE